MACPPSRFFLAAFLVLAACAGPRKAGPAKPEPAPPGAGVIVLRHATVFTSSGPAIPDGAVSFGGGNILAVGPNASLSTPRGAEEIDLSGRFVTPGIIDAHSHLGVYPSPELPSTSDGNEMTNPVTAEISAEHSFWPQDPGLRHAAAGGVTALLVLPGSGNLIGGRGFPVKLRFGRAASDMRFLGAKDALKMACGENPKRVYGQGKKSAPSTRMGNVAGYRQAFAQAQDYLNKHAEYEKKAKKNPKEPGPPPPRDLKLETLGKVLKGEILVQNHCYRADEMRIMIDIGKEFGFKIRSFHHALEAYKIRDVLAKEGVGVATWADWWGFKLEAWDGIPENAGLVSEAGARTVIHSDSPLGIQRLNQEAAKARSSAIAAGIPVSEEEALRWITLNPAWVMGIDGVTGSLEPGKMADLVVWDRHPLSGYAKVERTYADGQPTYDAARGAAVPSDFDLSAHASLPMTWRPAEAPKALRGPPSGEPPLAVASPEPPCTVIQGAVVLAEGGLMDRGSVLVRGGVIQVVSKADGPAPGCRVVEGGGKVLAPGFIEPFSTLGLVEITQEDSTVDIGSRNSTAEDPVHAAVRAADSVNPSSEVLPVVRQGGVTSSVIFPHGGLVSGLGGHLAMDGTVLRRETALHIRLGSAGASVVGSDRGAAVERLRELFEDARVYARRRQDFERNQMRRIAASRLDLEALQPVLGGRVPVVVSLDRASDIRAVLRLKEEFGLKIILAGAAEAWQVAGDLAGAKVPVILKPTDNLPSSFERRGARLDAAALLASKGVSVLISSMGGLGPHEARTLRQEAANAVAWGLGYEEAIRALSSSVARAFSLEGGRIAAGARADLVLWSGDPLDLSSRPLAMWIGGRQVPLQSRQTSLLEKYRKLPPS